MLPGRNLIYLAAVCFLALPIVAAQSSSENQQQQQGSDSSSSQKSDPASSSPSDSSDSKSSSSPSWHNPKKYNPMKLIRRNAKSANDQLASNEDLEQRLTGQLQAHGVLEKGANLQDKCSDFKSLQTCVAVIRASKSLTVEFLCLKWDVTGVKPDKVSEACAGPSDRKPMSFRDSISLLKPDADAKDESDKALKAAENDIKDASS